MFSATSRAERTHIQRGAYSWEPYALSVSGIFFSEYFVCDFHHAFCWGLRAWSYLESFHLNIPQLAVYETFKHQI